MFVGLICFLKSHPSVMDMMALLYNLTHSNRGYIRALINNRCSLRGVFLNHVKFTINGCDSTLSIGRRTQINNCTINISGKKCSLVIKGVGTNINNTQFVLSENDCAIEVDEKFTMEGGKIQPLEGTKIKIGKDCMFSSDVDIASGDYHTIIDRITGQRINPSKDISISDHVWLGAHVRVLKGVNIAPNTIIGNSSVVSKSLTEENCIYAGVPAKMIKKEIQWSRERNN